MIHKMKLKADPFENIKNGTKTIEFRLYDEKRQKIKIGDKIEFSKLPDLQEKILVDVLDIYKDRTFRELFEKLIENNEEIERKTKSMYQFYSKEQEEQYGVIGIKIKKLDVWEEMYEKAKNEYHPEEVSPFIKAHHVVAAVQNEDGEIFTGFCIEGASGVIDFCAERVAALNMYINTGKTKITKLIVFRNEPPKNGGIPCGACREFLMQLNYENKNMEILTDYETRKIVYLKDLIPNWWGERRYKNSNFKIKGKRIIS